MKTPIKEYKLKNGNTLKVLSDMTPESPREWDNLGKFVLSHKRYNLPNELNYNFNNFDSWESVLKDLKKSFNAKVIFSVRGYDHSGLSISCDNSPPFNDRWDSGQLGFIIATEEDIKKEFSVKKITKKTLKKVEEILKGEVEIYNKYSNGEVYGFIEEKANTCDCCKHTDYEVVNSVWGYYDIEDIEAEYKEQIKRE